MRKVFGVFNIPRMNFCNADFTYLDLVDTVNNAGNKIIFFSSHDGDGKTFSCPGSIFQGAVKILRLARSETILIFQTLILVDSIKVVSWWAPLASVTS